MPIPLTEAPEDWYDNKRIMRIQQSEIAFTSRCLKIIASSGAGPCVILILVDRISKQGFMTHLFSTAEISPYSVGGQWLIKRCVEEYDFGLMDCYIIGGYSVLSYCLIHAIEKFIDTLIKKIEVQNVYKHLKQQWVSNVVFDFENNDLFIYESYRDQNPRRKLDIFQGLMTSWTHLFPCCHLIEYQANDEQSKSLGQYSSCCDT